MTYSASKIRHHVLRRRDRRGLALVVGANVLAGRPTFALAI